jgi:Lactate racemase N-terminal domain
MRFPRMVTVRQELCRKPLMDPRSAVDGALNVADLANLLPRRGRVAVAVGSRGIDGLVEVLSQLVVTLKAHGYEPLVVPAMGSHGGSTAEGQAQLLRGLGVCPESVGAPLDASMETVSLGTSDRGAEVFMARAAVQSDGVIVVNKVAPHTGYSGPTQSGAAKMIAVGLGKNEGARSLHQHGFKAGHLISDMAAYAIEGAPVVGAVALLEDGAGELSYVEVMKRHDILLREPELLQNALSMWPRIPVASAHILIVDEIGKDYSGIGMDPMVTGRGKEFSPGERPAFTATRLVALRLSPGSGGNATGVGHADIITEKLFNQIDFPVTYRNVLTSGALFRAEVPVVAASDREAISSAIEGLGGISTRDLKVVRIRNTRRLAEMQVSAALAEELRGLEGIQLGPDEREMWFDSTGNLGDWAGAPPDSIDAV